MRCTQFIGLTKAAQDFVGTLKDVSSKFPDHKTLGMFEENIPLSVWRDKAGRLYYEIEQCAPWSSGPMIFTCLLVKDPTVLVDQRKFEWVEDYSVKSSQVDQANGLFYV